jgi:glycosyltransferase involved in cell wall biosynthesis
MTSAQPLRVLYSFPHKIGAGRICDTAWHQVEGLDHAGAVLTSVVGAISRDLPPSVRVVQTLSRGRWRIPYRAMGVRRACDLHDRLAARYLRRHPRDFDVVHCWPLGAKRTLAVADEIGVPTFLERPNAFTPYAMKVVAAESARLGVALHRGSEHAEDERVIRRELAEYELAHRILCPSEFVVRTFLDGGYPREKLVRTTRGVDTGRFHPTLEPATAGGFTALFVGYAAVRKGLHLALEAWLASPASTHGRFVIAGGVLPAYAEVLGEMLAHPSVELLGHREDVPELMRSSDVMILPSLEEGFGRVCIEAMASGSVPLVSEACTDECRHGVNALVHPVGDVTALSEHITAVFDDRPLLGRLRREGLASAEGLTWEHAAVRLMDAYRSGRSDANPDHR